MKNEEGFFLGINFSSKIFLILYSVVLLVAFFKTYSTVFDKKINVGGDNASYYILGNSIASKFNYTNIHTKENSTHNHYPPGYPLIIATASKLFSGNINFIKKLSGFFLLMSLGALFLLTWKLTENYHIPFIVCLFSLVNYHLLTFSVIMMSEIPFLFFSTFCFLLFLKTDFNQPIQKNWLFFVLVIFLSFTFHIRSTGIALFVAMVVSLFVKKKTKYSITMILSFILLALPWYLRSASLGGNSYMKQLFQKNPYKPELGAMELVDWFQRVWNNFERYVTREIPSGTFNNIEILNYKSSVLLSEWIIGIVILIVMFIGLIKLGKFFDILIPYIVCSFGILLIWPEVWVGVRFLIPLIPILLLLFVHGVFQLLVYINKKTFKIINEQVSLIMIVVVSLLTINSYAKNSINKLEKQANGTYSNGFKNYFQLATWSKTNTPDGSVISCRKGGLFYLYSKRYVTKFKKTLNKEEQIEYLKSKNTNYVVFDQLGYSDTNRYLYPAIKRYPEKFKIIKHLKNPDTYLMKFLPELGYWGDWKEDKKEGMGTYVWENQQKYEGEWKNDLRNGKGILYYPEGQRLEAVWKDDMLNGPATLISKDGIVIETSIYLNNNKVQ